MITGSADYDAPCEAKVRCEPTVGNEHLGRASEVLKALHEIENTLFMFEERLLGPRTETQSHDRLNPVPEGQGSYSAAMIDVQCLQKDSLISIERIVKRLQEFC